MANDPSIAFDDTRGPAHRHRIGDHMFYIQPLTQERWPAVSTALDMHANEDLDHRWRPGQAAVAAFRELPRMITATLTPPCGRTHGPCSRRDTRQHEWHQRCDLCPCYDCQPCMIKFLTYEHYRQAAQARTRGTAVHDIKQQWIANQGNTATAWTMFRQIYDRQMSADELAAWVETIRPYFDSFLRFVDDYGLTWASWEMYEATIINRTHRFAGTLDGQIRFDANATPKALELCERLGEENPLVTEDTKSREKEEVALYAEMAKQLAAYRRGETILLDDGTEILLPATNHGAVLQLRPGAFTFRPVVTDDATFNAFLGNLADAMWTIELASESTLVRAFPRRTLPGISPPPKKTTPRKTAAKKTARPVVAPHLTDGRVVDAVEVQLPLDDATPAPPRTLAQVAAEQSATLRSITRPKVEPHPNSPYDDEIPF